MSEKIIKKFDFQKPPRNPSRFWNWVASLISDIDLKGRNFICRKHNMDGLKPPYILLATHASMTDFEIALKVTKPFRLNNVASVETFHDYPEWLFRRLGVIAKRKFIKDITLLKNIKYSLNKLGNVFCIYPEARYTLDGTTSFLPDALAKTLKFFKVPVVVLNMKGTFITCPQWNQIQKHSHVEADVTQIITAEEINTLPLEEIDKRVRESFVYDDFKWQKQNNIVIKHPKRANGLHSILYQCPHCKTEFKMYSEGTELWCEHCGKRWEMTELGELKAKEGETEFSHIPDWFKWERANVREEVRNGTYFIEDDVRIDTIPNSKGFIKQGNGHFKQDTNGMVLYGNAYGKPFEIKKEGCEQESIHVEYAYKYGGDVFDLSTNEDSFWFYPLTKRDILTKVSFATEEIYMMHKEQIQHNEKNK